MAIGQDIALKIPMSWSKEKMADYISSYVVSHPEEMVSILDDEEIVLAHDIISGGKGNVLWKRHLLKYHHLKCMVWVVVNTANRGKDGFVMLDEISESFTSYIEQRYAAAKRTWRLLNQTCSITFLSQKPEIKTGWSGYRPAQVSSSPFEMNYMEDCHFWFRDEWFVDGYYECYNDWYRNDCKTTPYDLNQMVLIS